MSLTYGYELKENDDILAPAHKTAEITTQLVMPGAALVNYLPFCTEQSVSLLNAGVVTFFLISTTHPIVGPIV
jgi:hypothetical protein